MPKDKVTVVGYRATPSTQRCEAVACRRRPVAYFDLGNGTLVLVCRKCLDSLVSRVSGAPAARFDLDTLVGR